MNISQELNNINLHTESCIVIGSGILQALGIREAKDIDLVVSEKRYRDLKMTGNYRTAQKFGNEVLEGGPFEFGTHWDVLGQRFTLEDLMHESVVIGNVRYITLTFLLRVKKSWIAENESPREKDIQDVKLIEDYIASSSSNNVGS